MQACGYFRDSSGAGPLAEQNRAFLDYCEAQGFDVSATFFDRPGARAGFLRLIEYLRPASAKDAGSEPPGSRAFVVVVVPSSAALGDSVEAAAASYFALRDSGAQVVVLDRDEGEDGWAPRGGAEKQVGLKVRAAMRKRALKGEVLGRPPYGYSAGRSRRLEVVENEAAVVRYMFKLYLRENLGVRLIARRLNEEDFRTRSGKLWSMVSVRDILRNRAYLGNYQRLGVRVPGSHQKLVAEDDFKRVQERMTQRRSSPSTRQAGEFLLAGLVICGHCGNHMIGVSRRQKWTRKSDDSTQEVTYRYYQCQSRTNQGICAYHTRRADDLEALVRGALAGEAVAEVFMRECRTGDPAAVGRTADAEIAGIDRRLRNVDTRMGRLLAPPGRKGPDPALTSEVAAQRLRLEFERAEAVRRQDQQMSEEDRRKGRRRALEGLAGAWERTPRREAEETLREGIAQIRVFDDNVEILLR